MNMASPENVEKILAREYKGLEAELGFTALDAVDELAEALKAERAKSAALHACLKKVYDARVLDPYVGKDLVREVEALVGG